MTLDERTLACEALGLGRTLPPAMAALRVTGIAADSRAVRPGNLFFALPGTRAHGAAFAPAAFRLGAALIVTDAEGAVLIGPAPVPVLVHPDPLRALARAAAHWSGAQPATMVAVTGTSGKTSVASFTRQIWAALGRCAVNLGTIGVEGAVVLPLAHTTPDPLTLHAALARLAGEGVTHAAMEASSHGLDQRRLDGVVLAAAAFTNLGRDHLDYHADEEDYAAAKLGLFDRVLPVGATAVIGADDPLATLLRLVARGRRQRVIGVGRNPGADLRLVSAGVLPDGVAIRFAWAGREHTARLRLVGAFQAQNALMAAALAMATGEEPARVFAVLPGLTGVRGRMELAGRRANGAAVYVDYAHKPDAVRAALAALRPHTAGRLVCVLGAGGDRDAGKRPLMGRAATEGADLVIVTDDNPRSEDPALIRAAVRAGCPGALDIGDRAAAIRTAVAALGPGDVALIAGKGHESGQIVGGRVLPFDDATEARAAIAEADGAGGAP